MTTGQMQCQVCYELVDTPGLCTRCMDEPMPESTGLCVFDIETADAGQLHDYLDPEAYVRIAGISNGRYCSVRVGPREVAERVLTERVVAGHNIVAFDLPALARFDKRIDVLDMARHHRIFDTMIVDSVLNPIKNDKRPGEIDRAAKHFSLVNCCERHQVAGKVSDLKAMIKRHGGFDEIPVNDLEYREYCREDAAASARLATVLLAQLRAAPARQREYLFREHRVHAIASQMGATGLMLDQELLQRRFWAGYGRKNELTRRLIARYGIPTVKADGKPADSPASTKEGKAALVAAFASLGVPEGALPKTEKGQHSFSGDAMRELADRCRRLGHPHAAEIKDLCETIGDIAGVRTVYGTALEYLRGDGCVHPSVVTFQSSGRWSVRKPGLTVFGKRGGRVTEREIFRARPGHVLMSIDLAQIDARAVAVHSQDHAYLDIFEPGRDSHTEVAIMVWGDPARRQDAKVIGHGWNYGLGLRKLAALSSEETALRFDQGMREAFPRLVAWKDEIRARAETGGYLDNGFGRLMRPDPERAHTQGPALMGQGCARDLMMQCLLNVDDWDPTVTRMLVAQVHDEALWEVPAGEAEELKRGIERCFTFEWAPPGASRPIKVMGEVDKFGDNWAACY